MFGQIYTFLQEISPNAMHLTMLFSLVCAFSFSLSQNFVHIFGLENGIAKPGEVQILGLESWKGP